MANKHPTTKTILLILKDVTSNNWVTPQPNVLNTIPDLFRLYK